MMERNRKLRLLVTTDCPNHCPLCCNNSWDFSKLPSVTSFDKDMEWIKDCPVPKGEDFKRLSILWKE